MKITFPHMGNFCIPISAALSELGIEHIVPPPTGPDTLALGVRHSPESACFPLKLCVGNLLQAIEKGADSVLMAGGSGPCRFGYYAQMQRQIVEDLGLGVKFHIMEPPQTHSRELLMSLHQLLGKNMSSIPRALRLFWAKATACDELVKHSLEHRAHELEPGAISRWLDAAIKQVDRARTPYTVKRTVLDAIKGSQGLFSHSTHDHALVRVGIVGEIFMIMDTFANRRLEERLGHLGVVVNRKIYLTDWIRAHLLPRPFKGGPQLDAVEAARPYLNHFVGGDGQESVGFSSLAAQQNLDGIIHLYPFTCMPEIVAKSVLPMVSRDKGVPVLSLSLDEHSADAGLQTRLEAFCELMSANKVRRCAK